MDNPPVEVARFDNITQAQDCANRLTQAEIDAFVDNKEAGTLYGTIGMGMIGIRVLVRAEDAERALDVVSAEPETDLLEEDLAGAGPWTCGACKASVPGDHELCWSCGADTAGREATDFGRVQERLMESPDQVTQHEVVRTPPDTHAQQTADAASRRAYYAVILCFWLPLFPFISLVMAMRLPPMETLTPTARRHGRIAFWASLALVVVNLLIFRRIFGI